MLGAIIVLTGHGKRAIDLGAMQAGAADFLEKSRLDATLLERSIRYSLQQKQHTDELERRVRQRTEELALANEALQAEISERLRVEKALREAGRRKDEFLATLAHELRNPLVPIRNALEIMRLAGDSPETVESNRALDHAPGQATRPADRRSARHRADHVRDDPAPTRDRRDFPDRHHGR